MFAMAGVVSGIVSRTAGVLLVTYANPVGPRMLGVGGVVVGARSHQT